MKILKKLISFIIVLVSTNSILIDCNAKMTNTISTITSNRPVKVGVLLNNFYNPYNLSIEKSLEDIQKEKQNQIQFTFFNGESNPAIQSVIVNNMLQNNYDLLLISTVDKKEPEMIGDFVDKAKQKSIPLIFFNLRPDNLDIIKKYQKAIAINTDSMQAGILQGKMIADYWNANKEMDKNGDGIMQYILIKGQPESYLTEVRSNYSISTINDAGIETQELAAVSANWDEGLANSVMGSLFLKYGGSIEAIIANSDSMAMGAVKAFQTYGYNLGDKTKTIPIFGIHAIPEVQELIKKGFIAGSVLQDTRELADAFYSVGMNLILGKDPLDGTNYKFDKTGEIITIPFHEYVYQNEDK
ncbi:galactose ABC transporter substrate-binding protein [Clostridium saccharoperbutylacetonicum]|uniref:galactose ABC transporter substrate-binding protein n=1 Tax=Clostridium saccharoperbutylacetonicum TaxID=36745 RepID=UPI0039E9C917